MANQDELKRHEVVHTASIIMAMFDEHLLSHEAVESDPEVKAGAQAAFDELFAFYQLAADRLHCDAR